MAKVVPMPSMAKQPVNGAVVGDHRKMTAGWAWFSHDALARAVEAGGPTAALIYVALCIRESMTPPEHKAAFKASSRNLANECGLSSRTVKRFLPLLVRARLIAMERGRVNETREYEANTFRILEFG